MRWLIVGVTVLMTSIVSTGSSSESRFPSDSEIHRILSERIDDQKQSVGIVVGIVGPEGRRLVAHGHFGVNDLRPVNPDTVFEIGSVTKVFTALLLADMARRGEVELTDPVAKYLPEDVRVPQRGGKSITLADLASHTSGLPPMPDNFAPMNPANPYADYSFERLYLFLSSHRLARDIGARWEYSNLGYGLLGHALARRAGVDYETLIRDRILEPLGMGSTAITLSPTMKARLATGHDPELEAVPNWDMPTFAGAGALRSTTSDLLTFLEMALGIKESPLAPALAATLATRRPTGMRDENVGLGWIIAKSDDDEMIWHNGGTGGYRSFVGFLRKAKVGVVVLSNTFTEVGVVDYIGQQLLNPEVPRAPWKPRVAAAIDPKLYDGYVGRYQLKPNFILSVTREGDRLFAQASGQKRHEILPESERDFFYKVVDAQITFETDGNGHAASLTLHQNGRHMSAPRIEE